MPEVIAIDGRSATEHVLVGILNHPRDLAIARDQHWYRIPVSSARKWLHRHWPPQWMAFYQTKIFGENAWMIQRFARVLEICQATRAQLIPAEPRHPRAGEHYYKITMGPLENLPAPILSRRWRRIVFIPTIWRKFVSAREINDLYDESPLEDLLWDQLKRLRVSAERQEFVTANGNDYALDFALYCEKGKMALETDGDTWHADPARIPQDNRRDNDLHTANWKTFRFNGIQLREEMAQYCVPSIVENVQRLRGLAECRVIPREIKVDPNAPSQLGLFDDQ